MTDDEAMKMFESTDDARKDANVMRHQYRVLNDAEKAQMEYIKDLGLKRWKVLDNTGQSRELSLAKTKGEEGVMWAVKHITR